MKIPSFKNHRIRKLIDIVFVLNFVCLLLYINYLHNEQKIPMTFEMQKIEKNTFVIDGKKSTTWLRIKGHHNLLKNDVILEMVNDVYGINNLCIEYGKGENYQCFDATTPAQKEEENKTAKEFPQFVSKKNTAMKKVKRSD